MKTLQELFEVNRLLQKKLDISDELLGRMFVSANAARLALERGDIEHAKKMVNQACAVLKGGCRLP